MIKVYYGTDEERENLAKAYLKIFSDIDSMNKTWKNLRIQIKCTDANLFKLLPADIKKLLIMDYEKLVDIYESYVSLTIPHALSERLKVLFSYEAHTFGKYTSTTLRNKISVFFMNHADDMHLYTCHYCNMAYINTYSKSGRKRNHYDLDHVLDKGRCPIVALSFFNVVPVCPVCNGRIKSVRQMKISADVKKKLSPTSRLYDFDNNVTLWVDHVGGKCSTFGFEKRLDEYELKFDTHKDPDYDNEIEFFYLRERYNYHRVEALRLMDLKERYTESKIEEMARMIIGADKATPTGVEAAKVIVSIRKDVFADGFLDKYHRAFSKLHKDILK